MVKKEVLKIKKTKETKQIPSELKKQGKKESKTYDPWKVLKYPHLAEKSMNMIEFENKLVFIVDFKAKKNEVKEAVEKGFDVKVEDVNIEITRKGLKKAYVKLSSESIASDIASRLGIL